MVLLVRMLCRLSGCLSPRLKRREPTAKTAHANEPGETAPDDLTAIRGIGMATQNRFYKAGIKSYVQLARASPERLQTMLGRFGRGADVEAWIARARELAGE